MKLTYAMIGLASTILLSITALTGYFLFNWAFSVGNIFAVIGAYIGLLIIAFSLAFANGCIAKQIHAPESSNLVVAWLWVGVLVASAIYPWFKTPYTAGLIVVRALGTYFCLAMAAWTFVMLNLMPTKNR